MRRHTTSFHLETSLVRKFDLANPTAVGGAVITSAFGRAAVR